MFCFVGQLNHRIETFWLIASVSVSKSTLTADEAH